MPFVPDAPDLSAVRQDSAIGRAPVSVAGAPPKKSRIPRAAAAGAVSARKSIGYRIDGAVPWACAGGQRHDSAQARALRGA